MTETTEEDIRRHNESEVERAAGPRGRDYLRWSIGIGVVLLFAVFAISFMPKLIAVPDVFRAFSQDSSASKSLPQQPQ